MQFPKKPRVLRKDKNFSRETKELFAFNCHQCWVCGKNQFTAGHHILRGNCEESDSPLNYAPVHNDTCHLNKHFTEEENRMMLNKTEAFLNLNGYRLTEKDKEFKKINQKYYERD